ncbi:MAG: serine/threonine protein kinase, partial [Acidobacteria bacterium]
MSQAQKRFGRFETVSVLGRGGMGTVYLAVDPVIGRQVAIKEIRTDDETDYGVERSELYARFEQEFRSAGTLSHPNIVTIYDVGETDDAYYIAMEYVDGESLSVHLQREPQPSFVRICHLGHQIAAGLDFAHRRNIVHRDVKPANILVTGDGRVKISDFGIAKVVSSELTQTGTVLGTPAYMSPEQARGRPVDGRADQFSFALILYRMLTGVLPFLGEQPAATIYSIIHDPAPPPSEHNPKLAPAVDRVLLRALEKDPAARYGSCRELMRALAAALRVAAPAVTPSADGVSRTVALPASTRPVAAAA